jgi:hypothetical protein
MTTEELSELLRLAGEFYTSAESPTEEDMGTVFYHLAKQDVAGLKKFIDTYNGKEEELYTWDELTDEIQMWKPRDLWEMNREIGWESDGWLEVDGKITDVRATTNGRHHGLECWARDVNEANVKFTQDKLYRETKEGKGGE